MIAEQLLSLKELLHLTFVLFCEGVGSMEEARPVYPKER